jgi:hypothetical protein
MPRPCLQCIKSRINANVNVTGTLYVTAVHCLHHWSPAFNLYPLRMKGWRQPPAVNIVDLGVTPGPPGRQGP